MQTFDKIILRKCRLLFFVVIAIMIFFSSSINASAQKVESHDQRMEWWRDARFGMFIHWGVYSVLAGVYDGHHQARGGAEWIMNRMKIPVSTYQAYARQFDPVKYDPDKWVKMAKEAGMKYIVITAKHHDGFAIFKTHASKWNIVDATPYGKDVLKPLAEACKKYGIKLGFYYSQAQDWNNPGGAASRKLTREGWANPDSAQIDAYTAAHNGHWDKAQTTKTMDEYMDNVAIPQVKELLTHYGDVAVFWWDTPTQMKDEYAQKLQALLKLQPNIITNDRLKRPDFPGDYMTPEQHIPKDKIEGKDFEVCMTMNGTWGYRSYDHNWKSVKTLVRNLVDIASKGGNYLLNVGPESDGTFPQPSIDILKGIGKWMKVNSECIYGTKASPLPVLSWGRSTMKEQDGNTLLYLEVFDWPEDGKLLVPGIKNKILSGKLLANGIPLKITTAASGVEIQLPKQMTDTIATVIKLQLKGNLNDNNNQ